MKRVFVVALVLGSGLLASGCIHEEAQPPNPILGLSAAGEKPGDNVANAPTLLPDGYYSFAFATFAYSDLILIDKETGMASDVWPLGVESVGDNITSFGWTPFGLAFDVDGTMYITQNIAAFDPSLVRSQLARVDSDTGEVFPIGDPVPFNTSGPDIDACGNLYVCGFQVDALGYIWGNSMLWRVDKATGEFISVGDTGHTNWMDLAFDSEGTLWGTFDNELYTIDPQTGASTFVTEIHGVPDAGDPRRMEVMSIAFDHKDVLFGTAMTVYYDDPQGSPVMRIDVNTGEATLLGYTNRYYNHGGDIMPTKVRICHKAGKSGKFQSLEIGMDSLQDHLDHGDFVGCDCATPSGGNENLD